MHAIGAHIQGNSRSFCVPSGGLGRGARALRSADVFGHALDHARESLEIIASRTAGSPSARASVEFSFPSRHFSQHLGRVEHLCELRLDPKLVNGADEAACVVAQGLEIDLV